MAEPSSNHKNMYESLSPGQMHASSTPVIIPNHPTDYRTEYKDQYQEDEIPF